MSKYVQLINCLRRKTASCEELEAAEVIERLEQEAEKANKRMRWVYDGATKQMPKAYCSFDEYCRRIDEELNG